MLQKNYVIGVDYGTDSVRSVIVDAADGSEIASSIYYYPRWKDGLYCNPEINQFRQHPQDYIQGLIFTIRECLQNAGTAVADNVRGISVDTTGSTPVAVDEKGTPLALLPAFADNPNAMFILWKDHTAVQEALLINQQAAKFSPDYLQYVGGIYSSEWYWAKLLHILREDENIRASIASWVEHCDWIPFLLTGGNDIYQMKRSTCAAGHKGLWAKEFNGFPSNDFFTSIDPLLNGFVHHLPTETYTSNQSAGTLSKEWAEKLGLHTNVVVGIGAIDAHMGAVGGQIEPYILSKVMGTSTCDMLVVPEDEFGDKLVKGICGQVNGSIVPGYIGLEAGQSAFGDVFAWYKKILSWPLQLLGCLDDITAENALQTSTLIQDKMLKALSESAAKLPLQEDDEYAIDWLNGRRTPDANQLLHGAFAGLSLGSDAPSLFKALVEATCFGARAIVNRFEEEGILIKGIIGVGGVAKKSSYIMQVMANVMNRPIRIHKSEQTCAMGAAMFAATAGGIYPNVGEAMQAMGQGFDKEYIPEKEKVPYYEKRMKVYNDFGTFIESKRL